MSLTWKRYVDAWQRALRQAGFDPAHIVADKHIQRRPDLPDDHPQNNPYPDPPIHRELCEWWPADPAEQLRKHVEAQWHFVQFPGTSAPVTSLDGDIMAHRDTAAALRRAAGDPERICALMLNALLHDNARYPDERTVPYRLAKNFRSLIPARLRSGLIRYHHQSPGGMPTPTYDKETEHGTLIDWPVNPGITNRTPIAEAAQVLIDYQVEILQCEQPVLLAFDGQYDPTVRAEVARLAEQARIRKADDDAWAAEWARQREEDDEARRREEAELDAAHPRWREWPHIDRAELTRRVWKKPTRELAQDFGVSDVAIAKKCRHLGVIKPPRGFWAKVRAGKLPHPQGRPTDRTD